MLLKKHKAVLIAISLLACFCLVLSSCTKSDTPDSAPQKTADKTEDAGKTEEVKTEEAKEIKKFTMYLGDLTSDPVDDLFSTPVGQRVKELIGAELEIEYIVGSEEKTKAGIMIASEDYPDFVVGHNEHKTFIEAGAFIPIEGYIEKFGENIKESYGSVMKRLYSEDGHIYHLPPYREEAGSIKYPKGGMWLPADVLEDAGWPLVTKWDDYLTLIRDYASKNPEYNGQKTIGYTFITDGWRSFTLTHPHMWLRGKPNTGEVIMDLDTGESSVVFQDDIAKMYLNDLNDLFNEGLIEEETFAQNYDQYLEKMAAGRVLGFWDELWQFSAVQEMLVNEGYGGRAFVALPVTFDGGRDYYNGLLGISTFSGMSITVNCEDPEGAFMVLENLMSEDAQKLMRWGIQDEDYYLDEAGSFKRTDEMKASNADINYKKTQGYGVELWNFAPRDLGQTSDGNWFNEDLDPEYVNESYTANEKRILESYNALTLFELINQPLVGKFGLGWDVQVEDGSDAQLEKTKFMDLTAAYYPQLVMAKDKDTFESLWTEYVAKFNEINYQAYEQFCTEEMQRRIQEWN